MNSQRESLHEKTAHGKKGFPYTVYHGKIPEWLGGFPLHWHDEFEMIYVAKGAVDFTVEKSRIEAKAGDLALVAPRAVHSIERHKDEAGEYFNILFSFSLLEENPESWCFRKYFLDFFEEGALALFHLKKGSALNKKLAAAAKDLIRHSRQNYTGYELMVKSRLFSAVYLIRQNCLQKGGRKKTRSSAAAERLKKVLSYAAMNFTKKISIQDAASVCAISPGNFMKFFKAQTGMSFVQYLNDYRLEAAAERLLNSQDSVTDIALDNGFENVSYFIRSFRKKFSLSPREYRNRRF